MLAAELPPTVKKEGLRKEEGRKGWKIGGERRTEGSSSPSTEDWMNKVSCGHPMGKHAAVETGGLYQLSFDSELQRI